MTRKRDTTYPSGNPRPTGRREKKLVNDAFLSGVLVALSCVYINDQEGCAEEIVKIVGAARLLRVAKQEEDVYLPNLRRTANFLKPARKP